MPKYPCHCVPSCFDPCMSKGFFLQQIHGQGHLDKRGCPYTIYTLGHCEYSPPGEIRHLEVCGEPECSFLRSCKTNAIQVRIRIPLLLHLCACGCDSTEQAYIEDTVAVPFFGCTDELWKCRTLANACVRMSNRYDCRRESHTLLLDVHIQVFLLCGCVMQPSFPACPEPMPWYPQPISRRLK